MTREEILAIAKPILFNTEMVRAILDDRKRETRRAIKPPYFVDGDEDDPRTLQALRTAPRGSTLERQIGKMPYPDDPYKIGDYLYVRETFTVMRDIGTGDIEYFYAATKSDFDTVSATTLYDDDGFDTGKPFPWKPSIHMPKEAARLFLRVTDVRVERLQNITEDQANKEGCINNIGFIHSPDNEYDRIHTAREQFTTVWNSTITKKDLNKYGWHANPWVWVIRFEKVEV